MKIRRIYFILALLIAYSNSAVCQSLSRRDSLILVLKDAREDTLKVWNYISVGQLYESNNPDSAIWFYEQALNLSRRLKYTRGIISYYTNVTYVYNILGKIDTSVLLNRESVRIAREFGDQERLGSCLCNLGSSYQYKEQYDSAMKYYIEAIAIFDRINLSNKLHVIYGNLVGICKIVKDYDKAFQFLNKGLVLARESGDDISLLTLLNNGSEICINTGREAEAEKYLIEGIALARSLKNDFALASMLDNLGDLYLKKLLHNESIPLFKESLKISVSIDNPEGECIALRGLAYCYLDKKQFRSALEYASKSLEISITQNFRKHQRINYLLLSDINLAMGNMLGYYKYRYRIDSISSIIDEERISENVEEMEQRYKASIREKQIEDLESEKALQKLHYRTNLFLLFSLTGISFTILVILYMKARSNRQRRIILEKEKMIQQQRINELEKEKQLAASESVLKGQEEERKRLAKDLHDGLGGMLSGIKYSFSNMKENILMTPENQRAFERSMDMLDSSINELRRVAHNMMPESLIRFGLETSVRDICRDITDSGALNVNFQSIGLNELKTEQQVQIIIYRIVQELLNNVMKHAVAQNALVQLIYNDKKLHITVEDDGQGFDTSKLEFSKGIGFSNLKSRVDYLGGTLEVISSFGKGTTVDIELHI